MAHAAPFAVFVRAGVEARRFDSRLDIRLDSVPNGPGQSGAWRSRGTHRVHVNWRTNDPSKFFLVCFSFSDHSLTVFLLDDAQHLSFRRGGREERNVRYSKDARVDGCQQKHQDAHHHGLFTDPTSRVGAKDGAIAGVHGVGLASFKEKDIVRHSLVRRLLKRYKDSFQIMDEISAEKTISMWIHENGLDTLTETDGSMDDTFYKIKK